MRKIDGKYLALLILIAGLWVYFVAKEIYLRYFV